MSEKEYNVLEQETLNAELGRLIERYQSLKASPAIDKKWLNKVVSRLQEVQLFATQLQKRSAASSSAQIQPISVDNPVKVLGCTCPMAGVLDTQCPVHGGNR